jgi:DNA-binding SARP family transcriptional activator
MARCLEVAGEEEPYRIATARVNGSIYRHYLGDSRTALGELRGVLEDLPATGGHRIRALAHVNVAEITKELGELETASRALEDARYELRMDPALGGFDGYLRRIEGEIAWHRGERERGRRLIEESLDAFAGGFADERLSSACLLAFLCAVDDVSPPAAWATLGDGRHPGENELRAHALEAFEHLSTEPAVAESAAENLRVLADRHALRPFAATARFYGAAAARALDRRDDAARRLDEGLGLLEAMDRRTYPMSCPALTAETVVHAWEIDVRRDVARSLVADAGDDALDAAIVAALAREHATPIVDRLVTLAIDTRCRGLTGALEPHAAAARRYADAMREIGPPPLRVRAFGELRIVSHGRLVGFTRSASRRIFERLLVAHPAPVHAEVLIEQSWPEAEPAKGAASLRSAINALRSELDPHYVPRGPSYVAFAEEHYRLILPDRSDVDLLAVRDILARLAEPSSRLDDRLRLIRRALALAGGELLPGARYDDVAIDERARLQRAFESHGGEIADALLARDRAAEAVVLLEVLLDMDGLWSEGVVRLMRALHALGRPLAAVRLYRAHERRLREELGVPPDPSLARVFRELVRAA